MLFLIGVHLGRDQVVGALVNVFDETILDATRLQFHWAGRDSRGVTQLSGELSRVYEASYRESIDLARARQFVSELLDR
jgi:hypothetical protein